VPSFRHVTLAVLAVIAIGSAIAGRQSLDAAANSVLARLDGEVTIRGLRADVRVTRDRWGVPHISARDEQDLFFAQGYVMAQDRLWQMELWRRRAEGRLAEILGPGAVARDRTARLLRYRGPLDDREWTAYHPRARRLFSAYAAGVNAYVATHANRLPIEFVLTGITPEPWTAETLISRQITFGNAVNELQLARNVAALGAAEANRRSNPDPWDPLVVPEGLDLAALSAVSDALLRATSNPATVPPPTVLPRFAPTLRMPSSEHLAVTDPGSNNWVVSGALSATGKPVVANDPHREVVLPSLRYIVHLTAPGWNVIGAAEPPFVGVALGHNDRIAWGLTIVGTDQHDVYVEEMNPADPWQVRWRGAWEPMQVVREEIKVKGQAPQAIDLKFTRHGPVFFEDTARHRAYVLRSTLFEPGSAPYLAGLRLSQARNCREFLDAALYWYAPSENLVCGDVDGNISWQASALTPSRSGWTGRLPVPGTGNYEWTGFRRDLPKELNPSRGFIVTANNNVQPKEYGPPVMFKNADTRFDRITRLRQLITPGHKYTLEDHQRIQHDALSLRATADLPLFRGWQSSDPLVERARAAIAGWNAVYTRDSAAAVIYDTVSGVVPRGALGETAAPERRRDALETGLRRAIETLTKLQGPDWSAWRWGRRHRWPFNHGFVEAFSLPAVERGGGAGTVAADGASYREILDVADWDRSLAINVPGQSGQPGSAYYANLLPLWQENQYFPLVYSSQAVAKTAAHTLVLKAGR
jgi:penicillin G amidase